MRGCLVPDRLIHTRKTVATIRPTEGDLMTTEVAKPEGEDIGPFRTDQATRTLAARIDC